MDMPAYDVYYNGTNLSNIPGVSIYNYKVLSLAPRTLEVNKIASRDYSVLTGAEYGPKEITLYAYIGYNNRQGSESALSSLKAALQPVNKTLTLQEHGENINYTCSMYSIEPERDGPYLDVVIIMTATNPVGVVSTQSTFLAAYAITTQATEIGVTIGGSYRASPVLQYTLTAVTGGTAKTVTIGNALMGTAISVTRTWAAADVLQIDTENRDVRVNGAEVDYSGTFPYFSTGLGTISYVDDFTTRTASLAGTYSRKFI